MKCYVYKKEEKNERTGYWNKTYFLQGVGLSGTVPIRICYFGKPVMEAVMEKLIDIATGKPKLDKDGKEQFVEKKDKDGNVISQVQKDENGEDVIRDEDYSVREALLDMFAAVYRSGEVCSPVEVYGKKTANEKGETENFFIRVGKDTIPIEVIDFSTAERPDYNYRGNKAKLRYLANNA